MPQIQFQTFTKKKLSQSLMQFTIKLEESDEGGYTAQCLEIPAAISEGDTKEDALENIKEKYFKSSKDFIGRIFGNSLI